MSCQRCEPQKKCPRCAAFDRQLEDFHAGIRYETTDQFPRLFPLGVETENRMDRILRTPR